MADRVTKPPTGNPPRSTKYLNLQHVVGLYQRRFSIFGLVNVYCNRKLLHEDSNDDQRLKDFTTIIVADLHWIGLDICWDCLLRINTYEIQLSQGDLHCVDAT